MVSKHGQVHDLVCCKDENELTECAIAPMGHMGVLYQTQGGRLQVQGSAENRDLNEQN